MDYEIDSDVNGEVVGCSTNFEERTDDDGAIIGSSADVVLQQGLDVKVDDDSSERELFGLDELQDVNCSAPSDEPFVGQEFESEAKHMHFITHMQQGLVLSSVSASFLDQGVMDLPLVGHLFAIKRVSECLTSEKIVRQRAETRVGCRAMILVRKLNSGKWTVTKFVKEHTHPLTPGKGRKDLIYDQYPNEHDKIRELSQQLAIEKKKVATYKRHLEMIFEHIDEHNQSLANKVQDIVNSVREMESKEQRGPRY
ncbi:hypothetical protein DH2020_008582 [Rehmannia glutinosa]|uniref:FAR1 domain-containing protein n=1 Tax=Rehmannia glutinosa TaxID=99300 RepID=A0ABR0X714_REHGL